LIGVVSTITGDAEPVSKGLQTVKKNSIYKEPIKIRK
tara:strand:- start:49 stop:159 length:111 start_codon:yes stop_codon:yes gene_type:complete